jgi:hypothetical protein
MAPVRKRPAGTSTRPPPAREQASIAAAIDFVLGVAASGLAPNFVMSKMRSAKVGARTFRAMSAAFCHASADESCADRANVAGSVTAAPTP